MALIKICFVPGAGAVGLSVVNRCHQAQYELVQRRQASFHSYFSDRVCKQGDDFIVVDADNCGAIDGHDPVADSNASALGNSAPEQAANLVCPKSGVLIS